MRVIRACVVLLLAGCGHSGPAPADGGDGARCDTGLANACNPGLVCCAPCRGIPYPPDFGPIYGNCASQCQPMICA